MRTTANPHMNSARWLMTARNAFLAMRKIRFTTPLLRV